MPTGTTVPEAQATSDQLIHRFDAANERLSALVLRLERAVEVICGASFDKDEDCLEAGSAFLDKLRINVGNLETHINYIQDCLDIFETNFDLREV